MTKKEFLKRVADVEEFWTTSPDGTIQWTCSALGEYISGKARDKFFTEFFCEEGGAIGTWEAVITRDEGEKNPKRITTCRVMYFQLWVYRTLESKAYRGF